MGVSVRNFSVRYEVSRLQAGKLLVSNVNSDGSKFTTNLLSCHGKGLQTKEEVRPVTISQDRRILLKIHLFEGRDSHWTINFITDLLTPSLKVCNVTPFPPHIQLVVVFPGICDPSSNP